jgi:hypothetical protein
MFGPTEDPDSTTVQSDERHIFEIALPYLKTQLENRILAEDEKAVVAISKALVTKVSRLYACGENSGVIDSVTAMITSAQQQCIREESSKTMMNIIQQIPACKPKESSSPVVSRESASVQPQKKRLIF